MPVYLTPDQVAAMLPGLTRSKLAQLRFNGTGVDLFGRGEGHAPKRVTKMLTRLHNRYSQGINRMGKRMLKYQINEDLPYEAEVEADRYIHKDGYFHFISKADGDDNYTSYSMKDSLVQTIKALKK